VTDDIKLMDAFINMPVPPGQVPERQSSVRRWFKDSKALMEGYTVEELVRDMDEAGVEKGLLTARYGWHVPGTRPVGPLATSHGIEDEDFDRFCQEAAEAVGKFPDRFAATIVVDPMGGMAAVRQLERAVKEYGFVACRLLPSIGGYPIGHPLCYPIYTKCIELEIPITINIGMPGPMRPARMQRPMDLDEILLLYPELVVVGAHIGHPWHLETVALLQKHQNFHLVTSGWAPKYIPEEILKYMNSRGAEKVMWASDFPLLSVERAAREGRELGLKDEVMTGYLRENCARVFKL
jgi:predicted TIM-barrel fold metal-dependent hydrolase